MKEKSKIIIIDDELIVLKRLKSALEKNNYFVKTFSEGVKALQELKQNNYDIIVTDVRMPEIDGITILEHVLRASKNTKVILITGYATVEIAREALAKGAFDFIAKPFKPNDLRKTIEKALKV